MTASVVLFGLLWSLLRWRVLALGLLAVALGLLAPLTVFATGWLVGAIPSAVDGSPGRAVAALAVVAACFAATGIGETVARIAGSLLGMSYAAAVWGWLGDHALALPGIAELEDPAVAGEFAAVESLDRDGVFRQTVPALCTLITARVGGIGAVALTFGLAWWAPFVLCAGWWLAAETADRWFASGFGAAVTAGGKGLRRASYFREMATGPAGAKEIRIFGLAEWLGGRYAHTWRDSIALVWRARRGGGAGIALGVGAVLVSHTAVFTALALAGIHGSLDPNTATVYVLAILRTESLGFLGGPQRIAAGAAVAAGHVLALQRRLRTGPFRRRSVLAGAGAMQVDIRDLTFGYPGAQRPILDGLSLEIPAGQSLAVVGVNGSGKSTLIKLLCGLYPVPAGRIRIDGLDVADVDPANRLGVIFQDFVRYELSLRDNVSLHGLAPADVLADDLVSRLPDGWDTVLASGYPGGVDLSGGQWQRIALARALTAVCSGAGLLILDEPAAHLDIRAEAALFDRFLDLTAGVTTILVSHRLSGVRRADRIVVLDGGRIVEDGSHEELLACGGTYAAMFRLQAERFAAGGSR